MNPVKSARHISGFSASALAKRLEVSRQYINRIEQGLYDKPNSKILSWSATIFNKSTDEHISTEDIEKFYKDWQWEQRERVKEDLALRPCSVTEFDRMRQPDLIYYHKIFRQWRSDYWSSTHAFCVDFCLHPGPVSDYEEGETHTMPSSLKKVMIKLNLIGEGFKTNER